MTLDYFAGTRLTTTTFDALFAQVPRTFIKTSDQTYNTTTTLQNDEHLTCSLEANSRYEVTVVYVLSGTTGDIATAWSVPSGTTGYKVCQGPAQTSTNRSDTNMATAAHNPDTLRAYGTESVTLFAGAVERGQLVTTLAGTLTIQHTQNSSDANPSGVITNSFMTVRKIS